MKPRLRGLYFVVDSMGPEQSVLSVTRAALKGGVNLLQVWSPAQGRANSEALASALRKMASDHGVPTIINNDVDLATRIGADGVHMDTADREPKSLRKQLGKRSIVGYTTGNDMGKVVWADKQRADYISFCSVFPSSSVDKCEIVPLETLRRARQLVRLPIFASGGISLDNARQVMETGIDGIAVVSAVQQARDPEAAARHFRQVIDDFQPKSSTSMQPRTRASRLGAKSRG